MAHEASLRLSARLAEDWSGGRVTSVTWLNHHGALGWRDSGMSQLAWIDYIGVDGLLLTSLLGYRADQRTSADLVLPRLLPLLPGARIALVGARRRALDDAAEAFATRFALPPSSVIVDTRDGYDELPLGDDISAWLASCRPDVVIVGLGSGRQELWALDVEARMSTGLVITCGGYLDQISQPGYYPSWAYALRLNWAVRLAREPKRLWRRYSSEAIQAVRIRRQLKDDLAELPGLKNYLAAITTETA